MMRRAFISVGCRHRHRQSVCVRGFYYALLFDTHKHKQKRTNDKAARLSNIEASNVMPQQNVPRDDGTRQNSRTNTELEITYHWMTNSIILAHIERNSTLFSVFSISSCVLSIFFNLKQLAIELSVPLDIRIFSCFVAKIA